MPWPPACTPTRMNPAWLIELYASMRLTFVCTSAENEPTSRLNAAIAKMIGRHCNW